MSAPLKVLCLGGGYGSIYLAKAVRGAVRRGEIDLTVIDQRNFHTFHGLVPELLVGKIQAGQVISPGRRLFAPGRFVNATVEAIDVRAKTVRYSRSGDGRPYEIGYDHLVVNLGSLDDLKRYRGVGEHTMRLKSYTDCLQVRNHVLAMLELADLETDAEERRRLLTFVIAGGNYAGIETAGELSDMFEELTRGDFKRVKFEEVRIVVVHGGPHILPELGQRFPRLITRAEAYLKANRVELLLGQRIKAATPQEAVLADGTRIPTRTLISCTGTAPNPLLDQLPYPRSETGRLVADAFGRVGVEDHVWAVGDCAAIPMKNGAPAPPLALYAMHGGTTLGRNLVAVARGRALRPYAFFGMGDACVLGRRNAVAQLYGVPLHGFVAWIIWRVCMVLYLPSPAKRARLLFDWLSVPFMGRDIASVQTEDPIAVGVEMYEGGQTIVRQGDMGTMMYILKSGEVDVVREADGKEEVLARLGPGDHFGEVAVLRGVRRTATVRAVGAVEVLRLSRDDTKRLTESFDAFGKGIKLKGV
ncbi:MAG: FAD-dependent oxidoreductase [Gemmatimonadales bacterium]